MYEYTRVLFISVRLFTFEWKTKRQEKAKIFQREMSRQKELQKRKACIYASVWVALLQQACCMRKTSGMWIFFRSFSKAYSKYIKDVWVWKALVILTYAFVKEFLGSSLAIKNKETNFTCLLTLPHMYSDIIVKA